MSNADQIEFWNGDAGERWAQQDDIMANLLKPISEDLIAHADIQDCRSALDIGCGGGSQSVMLAQTLGQAARVMGVDISAPMLAVASAKADDPAHSGAAMAFVQADASNYAFTPGEFDLIFSRFGVMFFDDPVAAFTNIRQAVQADGRLAFCCWQSPKVNDWIRLPMQAALQHLPAPPPPDPLAPGPFAFSDPERIRSILSDSGFNAIDVQPYSTAMRFAKTANLRESVTELAMIGPISGLLADQEPAVADTVFDTMEAALSEHYHEGVLSLRGAIWFVTART